MSVGLQAKGHISASQITGFIQRRSQWFAEKELGIKLPPSPAMQRGTSIETGVRFALLGEDIDTAIQRALAEYDAEIKAAGVIDLSGKVEKEREMIAPSIELAVGELARFGVPEYEANGRQQKISLFCRYGDEEDERIEIIGFLDFVFPEIIIDLKSTGRMPSEMSWSHQVQRAIYARATNKPVSFCYTTPKKVEIKADGDISATLQQIKAAVKAMHAFLLLPQETQRLMAMPDPDDYIWAGNEDKRREIFGI